MNKSFPIAEIANVEVINKVELAPMLGLSLEDKTRVVKEKQMIYVKNINRIADLRKEISNKAKDDPKIKQITSFIYFLSEKNEKILKEVEKYRTAARLDNQGEIENHYQFDRLTTKEIEDETSIKSDVELLNEILERDSDLFTNFMAQALRQSETNSVIPVLKNIAEHHGYSLELKEKV